MTVTSMRRSSSAVRSCAQEMSYYTTSRQAMIAAWRLVTHGLGAPGGSR